MIGIGIRTLGSIIYKYPQIPEDIVVPKKYGNLKVALIADHFTSRCLSEECRVRHVTPRNYREVLEGWKPDLLFVESVFHGFDGCWRYRVCKQPKHLRLSKPRTIFKVINFAQIKNIPTVFWNKDDGAFFDDFIHIAKVFDYVFTTDKECISKYRRYISSHIPVNVLGMPYQPDFHNFTGFNFSSNNACFMGSYYRLILNERRMFLDMMFDICEETGVRMDVYDRNQGRISGPVEFKFPRKKQVYVHDKVPHRKTAEVYKSHAISLNVNSVTDSETMFSRRLLEILACGGILVTNPSRAVDTYFKDFCHVVNTREEAKELLGRLKYGPSQADMDRAAAGAEYVRENHTWEHRLDEMCSIVNL